MSDFHTQRTVTARKEHTCDWCYTLVQPGDRYERATGISGDFYSIAYHVDCQGPCQRSFYDPDGSCMERHGRGEECHHND